MENNNSNQDALDLRAIFTTLWQKRKVFYWVLPITFALSSALILCVPRYYTCTVVLAPESQKAGGSGSLMSLASSFGFNTNSMMGSDALYPMIYPEIVSSPDFLVKLFDTHVTTQDGEFEGSFYDYLHTKAKAPFWIRWKANLFSLLSKEDDSSVSQDSRYIDVFSLNKQQWGIIKSMQKAFTCSVDKKTEVITLNVTSQDPLVCAFMADSVCAGLQTFITDYRTAKYRIDLQYYENIMDTAYREYQEASRRYTGYMDSHGNMYLEQYRIRAKNLETEMQLKQTAYTSFQKQYLATQARLQENTPVFTVIQSASVPIQPAGPRRVVFVLAMLILATIVTSAILCKDQFVILWYATR